MKGYKEDRNEEKCENTQSSAREIEKLVIEKLVREENMFEKNENESEDGLVEHPEEQALESR